LDVGVLRCELVALRTGCFAGVAVGAVSDLVSGVFAVRTPRQVFYPIVGRSTVEMAALLAGWRLTLEGFEYLPVDQRFARATVFGQLYDGIALVVQALLQYHARTAYASEVARFIEPLKPGYGSPLFEMFATQNTHNVGMF
jgi:hypothetical protein